MGAITKGFEQRKSILLVESMGSGKTFMGGSAAIAVASGVVESLRGHIRDDQVVLVVAPPHLLDKWKRELHSISSNIYVERLDRHEQVRDFMDKAAKLGSGIAKIGLIKRDLTKLGCSRDVAVVWRNEPIALWQVNQPTPEGYEDHQRITKQRVPLCPHCGTKIMRERKGTLVVASEHWLKSGKRSCSVCHTPLWQEARGRGSRPKPGQKYATKNPRYRLDVYLKQKYADRVFLLVWDEVHECQSADTGNGESFGRLAGISQKVLGMTGTPFNGRASSMFNLEYHMNERIRQRYPWGGADRLSPKVRGSCYFQSVIEGNGRQRGRSESRWVADMGVREMVVEERPTYDSSTGAYTGTSTQSEIDVDDVAFWNIEADEEEVDLDIVSAEPVVEADETESVPDEEPSVPVTNEQDTRKVQRFVRRYLETVCILPDVGKQSALQGGSHSDDAERGSE